MLHPKQMTWHEAIQSAQDEGFIADVTYLDERALSATYLESKDAVARELARNLPGQVQSPPGDLSGLVWINGAGGPHGVIVRACNVPKVLESRRAAAAVLGGSEGLPWSIGGNARALLRWTGVSQPYSPSCERLLQDHAALHDGEYRPIPYGYHVCSPGVYDHCTHHDVSAYYYSMLCRVPSLRVASVTSRRIAWGGMTDQERERWYAVKDAVGACKPLRNCIAGVAAGSVRNILERPSYGFCRRKGVAGVKKFPLPNRPGPLRALGLLLVRSGVELTMQESAAGDCVYSNVDCVILRGDRAAKVWEGHGFSVTNEHRGPTEICQRGAWKCGVRETVPYMEGRRDPLPVAPKLLPATIYSGMWL